MEDFLPSPDALVAREDNVKVTIGLSRRSVEFFKRAAKQRRIPYQRMIRARNAKCGNMEGDDKHGGPGRHLLL